MRKTELVVGSTAEPPLILRKKGAGRRCHANGVLCPQVVVPVLNFANIRLAL